MEKIMLKLLWLRITIYRFFHRNESVMTPQINVTVHNLDSIKLKDRLNIQGYQFFPALSDQEVYLMNMEEWERINREEEK